MERRRYLNYAVICKNEKERFSLFYKTVNVLRPIQINMKQKKIIFDNDVYEFDSDRMFNKFRKHTFVGETMDATYFYEKWVE